MARRTKADAEKTRQLIIDAARGVFYDHGVHGTTLDEVASAAGVTRGAIYWHFKNKAELFFAVRAERSLPFIDGVDEKLLLDDADPLAGIERAMIQVLQTLAREPVVKRTHQIMAFRCEYVDELAPVFERIYIEPHRPFRKTLERSYTKAARLGQLRPGLSSAQFAEDSAAFMHGLMTHWLAQDGSRSAHRHALQCIRSHIALRRT
jgi:TetR/AcrR family acrAB operon transcriptional repressor